MTVNLENPYERLKLVAQMQKDVDAFCKKEFYEDPRKHLGASVIGHECQAYIWNSFRWIKFEEFSGRMQRVFNRGHLEEARFVRWLTGIGFQVKEIDEETKKQYRIVGCKGHFGGSLDSFAKAPARYELDELLVFLGEFKTHNEKSFTKLAGTITQKSPEILRSNPKGVKLSKPQHYKQMCSYGRAYSLRWGLYCAVNKDTDELYFEIVELDWNLGDDLFRKAEQIIFSKTRSPKISNTPTYATCGYCHFSDNCHKDLEPVKNCRSCINGTPVDNAEWLCDKYGIIPDYVIPNGCESWSRIA